MKPYIHAVNSAQKFGGKPEDYLRIHDWFDDTKAHFGDNRHRALKHHSQGIFECERLFGHNIVNSDGKQVSVRDIGEQHVFEDMGCVPTVSDYLSELQYQPWMHGAGVAPSNRKVDSFIAAPKKPIKISELEVATPPLPDVLVDGSSLASQNLFHLLDAPQTRKLPPTQYD